MTEVFPRRRYDIVKKEEPGERRWVSSEVEGGPRRAKGQWQSQGGVGSDCHREDGKVSSDSIS